MVEDEFKEGVNKLLNIKGQSSAFDCDSYDWGCLRYMLELWIFLNRLSKQGIRTIRVFFNTARLRLSENEELRKYDGQDYTAASMLSFFLFTKLARLKITRINKKIRRTATKWAGFNLMLYVLYGLGFVNILEDMKVEKRSNCVYTPLQISLSYIVKSYGDSRTHTAWTKSCEKPIKLLFSG